KIEASDDRVVDELDAGGVDLDVVGTPSATELFVAGGQLTDKSGKAPVVRIVTGLSVANGDRVVGRPCPSRGSSTMAASSVSGATSSMSRPRASTRSVTPPARFHPPCLGKGFLSEPHHQVLPGACPTCGSVASAPRVSGARTTCRSSKEVQLHE